MSFTSLPDFRELLPCPSERWGTGPRSVRDVNGLVAHAIGNGQRAEPKVDEQRHVATSDAVDTDDFHARNRATAAHFTVQIALRNLKHALIRLNAFERDEFLDLIDDKSGTAIARTDFAVFGSVTTSSP